MNDIDYPEVVICPECDEYAETVDELAVMADGSRKYQMHPCEHVVDDYQGYSGLPDEPAAEDTCDVAELEETADA